jgi:hypothetical protein
LFPPGLDIFLFSENIGLNVRVDSDEKAEGIGVIVVKISVLERASSWQLGNCWLVSIINHRCQPLFISCLHLILMLLWIYFFFDLNLLNIISKIYHNLTTVKQKIEAF